MTDPKYLSNPIGFLRESGLLFEINRQVLHPFGLALAVTPGEDEDEAGEIRLMDSREDPEGIVYAEETFSSGFQRLNLFLEEFGIDKMQQRREELGYAVQEFPDPYMKNNGVPFITYNPEYDGDDASMPNLLTFWVPFDWAQKEVRAWFDQGLFEFLDDYVYDQTELLYHDATDAGVIIHEDLLDDAI